MIKTVIVIPTYNEKENIEPLLQSIFFINPQFEVLFVDDNSPDGTAVVIRDIMRHNSRIHLLSRSRKEGIGRAYIEGFKEALRMEPDFIIQMDADLSHNPQYIPAMLKEAEKYDVVIGSRYIAGGGSLDWSWFRSVISRIGVFLCRLITGLKIRDVLAGFKCFNSRVIKALDLGRIKSSGFLFQLEMNCLINNKSFSYIEIPIIFLKRNKGKSKFSLGIIWEVIYSVWRLRNVLNHK